MIYDLYESYDVYYFYESYECYGCHAPFCALLNHFLCIDCVLLHLGRGHLVEQNGTLLLRPLGTTRYYKVEEQCTQKECPWTAGLATWSPLMQAV